MYDLKPPFGIYNQLGGADIADANGHLCSAENREIAEAILAALKKATSNERRGTDDGRASERERCAKIALNLGRALDDINKFEPYNNKPRTGAIVGEYIAAAILAEQAK